MQILLRDTRRAVRFPTEHLAALIKPHLINSDKGEKDRGSERGRIGRNLQPRHRFLKKKKERGVLVEGPNYILPSEAEADACRGEFSDQQPVQLTTETLGWDGRQATQNINYCIC